MDYFNEEPDYINENGTKWWFDAYATDKLRQENIHDYQVWGVEEANGTRSWVVMKKNLHGEFEPTSHYRTYEYIFIHINVLSLLRKKQKEKEDKEHPYKTNPMKGANRAFRGQ